MEKRKNREVRGIKMDDKKKGLADLSVWGETRSCHVGAADGLDLLYILEVAFIQQLHSSNKHISQSDIILFCCAKNCVSSVSVREIVTSSKSMMI